jgi:uncharacterized protein (DUF736 family)
MSDQYDDTNRGALFKNDKKETDRHPDYRGSLNVNGTDFWISAWLKESKNGVKYMSLSVTAKDDAYTPPAPATSTPDSDDVPF